MAHKKQRRVLNAVFSVQRMRTVMPIFWEVTRRVRQKSLWHRKLNQD